MRRLSLSLSLCLCVFALVLATSAHAQTKNIDQTVALDARGEVVIDTYKGSIHVETWDRPEVRIEVRIEADDDADLVEYTEVHIRETGRRLVLESDYDEVESARNLFGWKNMSLPFVHYRITMPATARLKIDDYKSETYVTGLRAELDVETYKGIVEIRDLDGAFRLDTYKGEVEVGFARLADNSSMETYKGDITVRLPKSAGFDLDAELGKRGHLDADFSLRSLHHGEKNYRGAVNGGGPRLRLDTHKGTFRVAMR